MADAKTLVFIHGSDPHQANTPWMFYHLDPASYTTPVVSEGKTFDLVYFDFADGTRKTWRGWTAKRSRKPPTAAPAETVPLTPKVKIHDWSGTEWPDEEEHPSVLAFYDWVKAQPAQSIASIQIFSHGTVFQPVLFALSYEWGNPAEQWRQADLSEPRDPNDTEFRFRDFENNNPLGNGDPWSPDRIAGERKKFRDALDPNVFIKVWGCAEYSMHAEGSVIRKLVTDYLAVKSGTAGDVRRSQLLLSYLNIVQNAFPYRMAERLDVPVWAGPVGWGSDPYESDAGGGAATAADLYHYTGKFPANLDKKEWWWRVSTNFRKSRGLTETFYKGALKAKLDPLGYVEYTKSWVTAAEDAANRTLAAAASGSGPSGPQQLMQKLLDQMQLLGTGRSAP